MKAILEGTAAEFRQFFRTGLPEDLDHEQVCMFCGCTDEDACPGGCSWVAPGVCSRCAGIIQEALKQDLSRVQKAAPEPKPTLLSEKNGAVVLAPFAEAERFDYSSLPKNNLGSVIWYENGDGRIAIKCYGHGDIVFITREQVEILKKMDKAAREIYGIEGYIVHICSGTSGIGSVRLISGSQKTG